jgi:hypothetical protein
LLLDEHGFGHDGTRAARTRESGEGRKQMQKQDSQVAHGTILTLRNLRKFPRISTRHAQVRFPSATRPIWERRSGASRNVPAHVGDLACPAVRCRLRMPDDLKWFQPAYRIPDRKPVPGELLFEFVRPSDRAPMSCELRSLGESFGWEAQILQAW